MNVYVCMYWAPSARDWEADRWANGGLMGDAGGNI